MRVVEVFRSLQGEGTRAGEPCIFVRLAGCDLRCRWCDTVGARDPASGMDLPEEEVLRRVLELQTPLCCITGGEPLIQAASADLARDLIARGKTVQVFTNGTRDLARLPPGTLRVVDLKTPWSQQTVSAWTPGMPVPPPPHFCPSNLSLLCRTDEAKFVVATRVEFLWAMAWADQVDLWSRVGAVFVTPVFGELGPDLLAEWVLDAGRPIRLGIQWHKVIWGPDTTR